MNRDPLLEIASYLEAVDDLSNYINIHQDALGWSDIIQRRYGLRVEDATQEDYELLSKYESLSKIEDREGYISSEEDINSPLGVVYLD